MMTRPSLPVTSSEASSTATSRSPSNMALVVKMNAEAAHSLNAGDHKAAIRGFTQALRLYRDGSYGIVGGGQSGAEPTASASQLKLHDGTHMRQKQQQAKTMPCPSLDELIQRSAVSRPRDSDTGYAQQSSEPIHGDHSHKTSQHNSHKRSKIGKYAATTSARTEAFVHANEPSHINGGPLFRTAIILPSSMHLMHPRFGPKVAAPTIVFNLALAYHICGNDNPFIDLKTRRQHLSKAARLYDLANECLRDLEEQQCENEADEAFRDADRHRSASSDHPNSDFEASRMAGREAAQQNGMRSNQYHSSANGSNEEPGYAEEQQQQHEDSDSSSNILLTLAIVNNLALLHKSMGQTRLSKAFFERLFVILMFVSTQGWDWDEYHGCRTVASPSYRVFYDNAAYACLRTGTAPAA